MLQRSAGQHVACAADRLDFVTQRPVQPHQDLPAELDLGAGVERHQWVPIEEDTAVDLDLMPVSVD